MIGWLRAAMCHHAGSGLLLIGALIFGVPTAYAQRIDMDQIRAFQDQIIVLQGQLDALTQALAKAQGGANAVPPAPIAAPDAPAPDTSFVARKVGKPATFVTHGGEIALYGVFHVALDAATKGMRGMHRPNGAIPVGNMGWQGDISSNMSFVGLHGVQAIGSRDLQFVYQLETQIDLAATSGVGETNSSQSNVVKAGLTSRNSYIGLTSPHWGTVAIGKGDGPYKLSTLRMNPFVGMLGDYGAIMANTAGGTGVDFAKRLDHAIWYESPDIRGLWFNALFAPGQNRASNSDNIAAGESECTGGNIPGSGGSLPIACNAGAFSDAVSASLGYAHGPLYLVAAYERHGKVNRSSDLTAIYASPPDALVNADTADESAAKLGIQITLPTGTAISGIFERFHRYVPQALEVQNERQRDGWWLSASQHVAANGLLAIGWAHAGRSPGAPSGGAHVDNAADLATVVYKRNLGMGLSAYVNGAKVFNHAHGRYALGAGGRSVAIDCHDASGASGGIDAASHCWSGARPEGISTGLRYQF